jgi:hypothetical protein
MYLYDAYGSQPSQFLKPNLKRREGFALPSEFITDKTKLDPSKFYTVYNLKPGVTTTTVGALYGGQECNTSYPQTVYKVYAPTTADNAVCDTSDAALYIRDPSANCTYANNLYTQNAIKKTDSQLDQTIANGGITITPAKYGAKTCSQQFGSSSTTFAASKLVPYTSGAVCPNLNAVCSTNDLDLYSDPGLVNSVTGVTNCIRDTTDGKFYRNWIKKSDKLDTAPVTIRSALPGGATCSTQLSSTTTYPNSKRIAGNTQATSSFCSPVPAVCADPTDSNTDTNYTYLNNDGTIKPPVLGISIKPVDCSFTINEGACKIDGTYDYLYPVTNYIAPRNGGKTCDQFLTGTLAPYSYYKRDYDNTGTLVYLRNVDGCRHLDPNFSG